MAKRVTPPAQPDNSTAHGLPPIPVGERIMVVRCPSCLQAAEVLIDLSVRHTAEPGGKSTLKGTMHTKPVKHVCGQISTLDVNEPDAVGTRPMEFTPTIVTGPGAGMFRDAAAGDTDD